MSERQPISGLKKDNLPFFSIIIANLNYGRFLEEAILSIINQSFKDFEIVLIDGGSNDESVDIIKKYMNNISWWCSEPDYGQSHAFNKGYSNSKGKFLTWLNADDIMLPNTLELAYKKLNENPSFFWLTGNFIRFSLDYKIIEAKWGPNFLPKFLQKPNSPIVVFGPSAFFARDLLDKFGGFDEECYYTMDTELWLRFMFNHIHQIRLNHYCWGFRMHTESKTAKFYNQNIKDKITEKYEKETIDILDKYNYKPSKLIRLLHLGFRVFDGSLIISFYNRLKFLNKPLSKFYNSFVT